MRVQKRRRRNLARALFRGILLAALVAVAATIALLFGGDELNSKSAILTELGGEILLDVKSGERVYPASLTKMMTAVVVIESEPDYSALVTLEQRIFYNAITQDLAIAGFLPGESVTVRDLLYGMM
jgi:D-alanyl-D-alanine carboxypeptidase (penicillin-binding protein 5/6)